MHPITYRRDPVTSPAYEYDSDVLIFAILGGLVGLLRLDWGFNGFIAGGLGASLAGHALPESATFAGAETRNHLLLR